MSREPEIWAFQYGRYFVAVLACNREEAIKEVKKIQPAIEVDINFDNPTGSQSGDWVYFNAEWALK